MTAKGNGSSLVQLSYKYNTIDNKLHSSLRLNVTVRENTPPKKLIIDICAQFVPSVNESEEQNTNIIVIEATLPSGFTTNEDELDKLRDYETILFTETKKSDSVAIIYLRSLGIKQQKCLLVEATRTHEVTRQKRAPIIMYDYYDENRKTTEFYGLKTFLCDICQGSDCKIDCLKKNDNFLSSSTLYDLPQQLPIVLIEMGKEEMNLDEENMESEEMELSSIGLTNITEVKEESSKIIDMDLTDIQQLMKSQKPKQNQQQQQHEVQQQEHQQQVLQNTGQFQHTRTHKTILDNQNLEITLDAIYEEILSLRAMNANAIALIETLQDVKKVLKANVDELQREVNYLQKQNKAKCIGIISNAFEIAMKSFLEGLDTKY